MNTHEQIISAPSEVNGIFPEDKSIIIIGMAAAGKSTMGRELAKMLGWLFVDSDNLIESAYGTRLQNIADILTKDEFLDMEATVIQRLRMQRCVIATGGSVVYRPQAVEHLRTLGPLLHLDASLEIVLERIARKPDRGLAIAPGQTVEDLYNERKLLYQQAEDLRVASGEKPCHFYAQLAIEELKKYFSA
ncbi:MAG: shikimate kinase [Deltaproteobacteria bacterium]|jgi:shikimate kinase|nr:shikimate kinase [Deltaproteobacteria bacterium]